MLSCAAHLISQLPTARHPKASIVRERLVYGPCLRTLHSHNVPRQLQQLLVPHKAAPAHFHHNFLDLNKAHCGMWAQAPFHSFGKWPGISISDSLYLPSERVERDAERDSEKDSITVASQNLLLSPPQPTKAALIWPAGSRRW